MQLQITIKTYNRICKEVEKEKLHFGYRYFNDTLDALIKCIDKKREIKLSTTTIRLEKRTLSKLLITTDDKTCLIKLTSKMESILFPKKSIEKVYAEPKETNSLFE